MAARDAEKVPSIRMGKEKAGESELHVTVAANMLQ